VSSLSLLIAVLLFLLAVEVLFETLAVRLSLPIFEHRPPISAEMYPADLNAEPLNFRTRDGLTLAGSWWRCSHGHPRGVVLFCHELGSNRWSALSYCEGLIATGFHVVTFDFRNHGDSQSRPGYVPTHWATRFEIDDIRAALAGIGRHPELGRLPLGVFGMSRGGTAALVAAAECERIRCVASDGALACVEMQAHYTDRWGALYFPERIIRIVPEWHKQFTWWLVRTVSEVRRGYRYAIVERAVARLQNKPVLLISGARDTYINPEITRRLYARTGQPESADLWIVPEAKHNAARQTFPREYDARLADFFSVLDPATSEIAEPAGALASVGAAGPAREPSVIAGASFSPSH
jgi:pimeloyl-ACP methyl ester carboxylesterase